MSDLDELRGLVAELASLTAPAGPGDGDGLTDDEWRQLFRADEMVKAATEAAAVRRLKKRLPAAQRHLKSTTDALDAAKRPARTMAASIAKVEADLAEASRRLSQTVVSDDDDLDTRTAARVGIAALTEEVESLTLKLGKVRRVAEPHLAARGEAEGRREAARAALKDLERAIDSPFSTATGRDTPEFERYVRYAGAWEEYPDAPAVRRVLIGALRFTGLYDGLVREIVSKWLDGDPEIRKQSRILRDDSGLRVEQAPNGQVIAFDVRGRSRVSGETDRTPDPAPDMTQVTAALYGSARTP